MLAHTLTARQTPRMLSREEAQEAARAARRWPRGFGSAYAVECAYGPLYVSYGYSKISQWMACEDYKKIREFGSPEVCAALTRLKYKWDEDFHTVVHEMTTDITIVLTPHIDFQKYGEYHTILDKAPKTLARLLEKYSRKTLDKSGN